MLETLLETLLAEFQSIARKHPRLLLHIPFALLLATLLERFMTNALYAIGQCTGIGLHATALLVTIVWLFSSLLAYLALMLKLSNMLREAATLAFKELVEKDFKTFIEEVRESCV